MKLTEEQMNALIEKATADGYLNANYIDSVVSSITTHSERNAVDILHSFFCSDRKCEYIKEAEKDDEWNRPDHVRWTTAMRNMRTALNISTDELCDMIGNTMHIMTSTNSDESLMIGLYIFRNRYTEMINAGAGLPVASHRRSEV